MKSLLLSVASAFFVVSAFAQSFRPPQQPGYGYPSQSGGYAPTAPVPVPPRYRIVNGQLYNTSASAIWHPLTGKLLQPEQDGVRLQTYRVESEYATVYHPSTANANQSIGAFSAGTTGGGWRKQVISSEIVPDKQLFIRNYHFWNATTNVTIIAMETGKTNLDGMTLEAWDIGTLPVATTNKQMTAGK